MNPMNFFAKRRDAEKQVRAITDQLMADVSALQSRIREANNLVEDARIAPVDASTIKARATALVDSMLADMSTRSRLLDLLSAPVDRYDDNDAAVASGNISAFHLAAITDRSGLIKALVREGEAASQNIGKPMNEASRAETIAKLTGEIRSLGAAEELLFRSLETTGAKVSRRGDADLEIVAGVDADLQRLADSVT